MDKETIEALKTELFEFLSNELSVGKKSLNLNTSLVRDIGLAGDDAADLLEKLMSRYDIIDTRTINFTLIFGNEAPVLADLILALKRLFKIEKRVDFTIRDVLASILEKKWIWANFTELNLED